MAFRLATEPLRPLAVLAPLAWTSWQQRQRLYGRSTPAGHSRYVRRGGPIECQSWSTWSKDASNLQRLIAEHESGFLKENGSQEFKPHKLWTWLERAEEDYKRPPLIMFLGSFNSGKSTLIKSMFGIQLGQPDCIPDPMPGATEGMIIEDVKVNGNKQIRVADSQGLNAIRRKEGPPAVEADVQVLDHAKRAQVVVYTVHANHAMSDADCYLLQELRKMKKDIVVAITHWDHLQGEDDKIKVFEKVRHEITNWLPDTDIAILALNATQKDHAGVINLRQRFTSLDLIQEMEQAQSRTVSDTMSLVLNELQKEFQSKRQKEESRYNENHRRLKKERADVEKHKERDLDRMDAHQRCLNALYWPAITHKLSQLFVSSEFWWNSVRSLLPAGCAVFGLDFLGSWDFGPRIDPYVQKLRENLLAPQMRMPQNQQLRGSDWRGSNWPMFVRIMLLLLPEQLVNFCVSIMSVLPHQLVDTVAVAVPLAMFGGTALTMFCNWNPEYEEQCKRRDKAGQDLEETNQKIRKLDQDLQSKKKDHDVFKSKAQKYALQLKRAQEKIVRQPSSRQSRSGQLSTFMCPEHCEVVAAR